MGRRKAVWWIGVAAVAWLWAVWILLTLLSGQHLQIPHPEALSQIKVGMTEGEVEALLGCPSGHYGRYASGRMEIHGSYTGPQPPLPTDLVPQYWFDDTHCLRVWFDSLGRAVRAEERPGYRQLPGPSTFDMGLRWLRARLGL